MKFVEGKLYRAPEGLWLSPSRKTEEVLEGSIFLCVVSASGPQELKFLYKEKLLITHVMSYNAMSLSEVVL